MIRTFLAALPFLLVPEMARGEIISAVGLSTGPIVASISGYRDGQDVIVESVDARWLSFRSRILSAVIEFQAGKYAEAKLTQIMETRAGIQYYPLAFGTDFEDIHEFSTLRYSSALKPYLNLKAGWGRYMIQIYKGLEIAEVSSNYLSLGVGVGTHYSLVKNVALDANVDASIALGTSVAAFTGLLLRPRFGAILYL